MKQMIFSKKNNTKDVLVSKRINKNDKLTHEDEF